MPIVIISDMQQKQTIQRLVNDPEIGPNVIVPAFDLPNAQRTLVSDMILAAKSSIFVGPRVSSMTVIIGQMRAAQGASLETNKIFVRKTNSSTILSSFTVVGDYEICGECIFYCNVTATDMCGHKPVYA